MNTPFASLVNTMLPALALVASVDVLFRLWRGVNAATRFLVWWLVLAAVILMPLAYTPERHIVEPVPVLSAPEPVELPSPPAPLAAELPQAPPDLRRLLTVAAGAVAAAMLAQLIYGYLCLRRTKRRAAASAKSQRLDYLLLRHAISRPVRLLETASVKSPVAAGFRKPAVLLPPDLTSQLSAEELDHVLLHEAAHLARRDDWTNLIAQFIRAALWFHPAVRWILHRMEQERELACDDWAAQASGERRRYAASLTRLVELRLEAKNLALVTGALGGKPRITRRVESLLNNVGARGPGVSVPKVFASFGAVALLAALCSQGPELVAAEEEIPAPEPVIAEVSDSSGSGYLDGMASAGYSGLGVDDLIELKNNGVTPEYAASIAAAGLGKLPHKQLIELHNHGVQPAFVKLLASSGVPGLTNRSLINLVSHGVRAEDVAEIHSLGFGPYSAEQLIDFAQRGIGVEYFRSLKENGIGDLDPRDIVDAAANGVSGNDILEARRYHSGIDMKQIIKLKQAGVI